MKVDASLDYYASLLIQRDESNLDNNANSPASENAASGIGEKNKHGAFRVFRDCSVSLKAQEEAAQISCYWSEAHNSLVPQSFEQAVQSTSVMHKLITANQAFPWKRCYYYYTIIQKLFDEIVWENSCRNVFEPPSAHVLEMLIIEHVAIIALEASLQALKSCNLSARNDWCAAGDVLILLMISLANSADDAACEVTNEQIWRETAMMRLLQTIQQLAITSSMKKEIENDIKNLKHGITMEQPLMESLPDVKRGLPFILYLYRHNLNHKLFNYLYMIANDQYVGKPILATNLGHNNDSITNLFQNMQTTTDLPWQKRYENFVRCNYEVDVFINTCGLLVDSSTLKAIIHQIVDWLVKEFETATNWVNAYRRKTRAQAISMSLNLLRVWDKRLMLWEGRWDTLYRLINLVARTWALEVSGSPLTSHSPTPETRKKHVDNDKLCDNSQLAELLAKLAQTLEHPILRGYKKNLPTDQHKIVKLLDDLLDQIIIRNETRSLPIFLDNFHGIFTREDLVNQRKTAQTYFASWDNAGDNCTSYEEVYRAYEGGIMPIQTLSELIKAEMECTSDKGYSCKLLSYISDATHFSVVIVQLYCHLIQQICKGRRALLTWWNQISEQENSIIDVILHFNKVVSTIGSLHIAHDAFSHYSHDLMEAGHLVDQYLKELQRFVLDVKIMQTFPERGSKLSVLQQMFIHICEASVQMFGDKWLPLYVTHKQMTTVTLELQLACRICMTCDWIEENLNSLWPSGETSADLTETLTWTSSSSSLSNAQVDLSAEVESQVSESSIADFIDLTFEDDYRRLDEASLGLFDRQLAPELYNFVKNAFWDDRMSSY